SADIRYVLVVCDHLKVVTGGIMGLDGLGWLASGRATADYQAYAITNDDRAVWTEGMERYLVRED
ncbi:MAG: hypothetical protein ABJC39_09060, partial [Chloroflexota bacterium]